ncbi:MAG TPA: F0F1 ATP synthase subunit beta, partial [bacterium]|nr:F0F1 ATP synthase subunit beta [bacterium]
MTKQNLGTIEQIIGPVVDVKFDQAVPPIFQALTAKQADLEVVLEVQQHLGGGVVRTIAMDSTDGLRRGQEVVDTKQPIRVPVGEETLGRMFNVLGKTIDGSGEVKTKE